MIAASDWPRLFLHPRCFCLAILLHRHVHYSYGYTAFIYITNVAGYIAIGLFTSYQGEVVSALLTCLL